MSKTHSEVRFLGSRAVVAAAITIPCISALNWSWRQRRNQIPVRRNLKTLSPHIFREYVLQRFYLSPGPLILIQHLLLSRTISTKELGSTHFDVIRFRFEILLWLGEHLSAFARHLCFFFLKFFLSVPQGYDHGEIGVPQHLAIVCLIV